MKDRFDTSLRNDNQMYVSASDGRSKQFYETTNKLSDYIQGLDLTTEQNDKLIALMMEEGRIAEFDAFLYGLFPRLIRDVRQK